MKDNSKHSPGVREVMEIFKSNDKFEFNMAFIPFYNRSSIEEKIRFCSIMIGKCVGKKTALAMGVNKKYNEDLLIALQNKIIRDHCE